MAISLLSAGRRSDGSPFCLFWSTLHTVDAVIHIGKHQQLHPDKILIISISWCPHLMIIKCCTLWTVFLWSFQVRAPKCQIFMLYKLASCLLSNVMLMGLDMWWLSWWCNLVWKFPGRPSWHCYLKTWWLLSLREIQTRQLHFKLGNLYFLSCFDTLYLSCT